MITIGTIVTITTFLITLIVAALGWSWKQSIQINENKHNIITIKELAFSNQKKIDEMRSENLQMITLAQGIDSKIDKKVGEASKEFTEILNKVNLTLQELNITMKYVQKEVSEMKGDYRK